MIRIIAGIVGVVLVGVAAHATILLTGGYGNLAAAVAAVTVACGVAVGAAALGVAARQGRTVVGIAIGACLAAGAVFAMLDASERVTATRDAAEAAMRDAQLRHDEAEKQVTTATAELQAAQEKQPPSARETAAQTALDATVNAIRDQVGRPACPEKCRQLLMSQATDARLALETIQGEAAKAASDRLQEAERAHNEAQAKLMASPAPIAPPASMAERIGMSPALADIAAVLLSLGLNSLGGTLIGLTAHGHPRMPNVPFMAGRAPAANDNALGPKLPGRVSQFVGLHLEAAPAGRIEMGDLYKSYKAWCRSSHMEPVDVTAFGDDLREALDAAGIRLRAHVDKVYLVGVIEKAA